jgi:hypothetical protein
MADNNSTDLPAGVSFVHEYDALQRFVGAESALISAGWVRPEWLEGLGRYARQIALNQQGGFSIIGEGKGNRLKHEHREAGAVSVRRRVDGLIELTKYRAPTEIRERERLWREERAREAEALAWTKAKQARDDAKDFPKRWKKELARRIDELARLIDRRAVFQGFPNIKLPPHDLARLKYAVDYLRHEFDAARPTIDDIEIKSNVISLRANAHRNLSASR